MNTQTRTSVWACTWCILKIATCSASQHSRAYRFRSFLKFQHIPASVSFSVVLDIFKFFCLKHDFKLVSCTVLWYKSYKTLSVIRSARYVHGILFVRPSSCMWTLFSWTLRKISYHPHLSVGYVSSASLRVTTTKFVLSTYLPLTIIWSLKESFVPFSIFSLHNSSSFYRWFQMHSC